MNQAFEDIPLPGLGEPPPLPPLTAVRYASFRLCSDCVAEVHRNGVNAQPSQPVRWQVSRGSLTVHVCERHKRERAGEA